MQSVIGLLLGSFCGLIITTNPTAAADCLDNMDTTKPFPQTPDYSFHSLFGCLKDQISKLKAEVDVLDKAVYNNVDQVYTISHSFSNTDFKDAGASNQLIFSHYIYADPEKHVVTMSIFRRQNSFNFYLSINGAPRQLQKNDISGLDLTPILKAHPLQPSLAGVDSAMLAFPANVQLIELQPTNPNWDAGMTASFDGYIIVQRALPGAGQ